MKRSIRTSILALASALLLSVAAPVTTAAQGIPPDDTEAVWPPATLSQTDPTPAAQTPPAQTPALLEVSAQADGSWRAQWVGPAVDVDKDSAAQAMPPAGAHLSALAQALHQNAGQLFNPGPEINFELAGRVQAGQVFTLALPCQPSTGYGWQPAGMAGDIVRAAEFPVQVARLSHMPGTPAVCVMTAQAQDSGYARLALAYRRLWLADTPAKKITRIQAAEDGPSLADLARTLSWPVPETPAAPATDAAVEASMPDAPALAQAAQALPGRFNWCEQGKCPPVRDQRQCGSCWAFATVGVIESVTRITHGANTDFSEQFFISCNYQGWGCSGGWWPLDMAVDRRVHGESMAGPVGEWNFPYTASDGSCNGPYVHRWQGKAWGYVNPVNRYSVPDVNQIKQAIYSYGPVVVAVATGYAFHTYTGGVFQTNEASSPDVIDHAVVLVGWDDAGGYWIARNSWGPDWGEHWSGQRRNGDNGYMRIKYGISNIGFAAAYLNGARFFGRQLFLPGLRGLDRGVYPVPNGDFEALGGWKMSRSGWYSTWYLHAGRYSAGLGFSTGSITQTVTVPAQASRLRFWRSICSGRKTPGTTEVRLGSAVLRSYNHSQADRNYCSSWQLEELDVSPYRGQRLALGFYFSSPSDDGGIWFMDDLTFVR